VPDQRPPSSRRCARRGLAAVAFVVAFVTLAPDHAAAVPTPANTSLSGAATATGTGKTPSPCPDGAGWVATTVTPACVRVGLRQREAGGAPSTLHVYVHGDANPVALDNHLLIDLRRRDPAAATAVILRPGYADQAGWQTTAVTLPRPGDAYRREDALAIGEAVALLKARLRPRHVALIGHSGGAAVVANVAALFPGLVDHVVIASCPCNLAAWRAHQARTWPSAAWYGPYRSLSPHLVADDIPSTTSVTLLVGEDDKNTPLALHQEYLEIVRKQGCPARLFVVPGAGHAVFGAPAAIPLVAALLSPTAGPSGTDAVADLVRAHGLAVR